jgi:hypothetical protein
VKFYSIKYLTTRGIEEFEGELVVIEGQAFAFRRDVPYYDTLDRVETWSGYVFKTLAGARRAAIESTESGIKYSEQRLAEYRKVLAELSSKP